MKTFNEIIAEIQQPLSQGEKNFKDLHGVPVAINKDIVPGVTDQDFLFKGHKREFDAPTASYEKKADVAAYDKGLKVKEVSYPAPGEDYKPVHEVKNEGMEINEATLSPKAARAGKDIGAPGKNFSKIAKVAAARYGSEEAGKRVAGAILAKMRANEEVEQVDEGGKNNWDKVARHHMNDTLGNRMLKKKPLPTPGPSREALRKLAAQATHVGAKVKEEVEQVEEKTLTPAEMKKREEVAKALKREHPGMPMAKKMAIATATAKRVAEELKGDQHKIDANKNNKIDAQDFKILKAKKKLAEEADFDYEGEMAKAELNAICDKAGVLADMLENDTQLEAWLQSKITKAKYMIDSVYDYMMYSEPNVKQEPEDKKENEMEDNYSQSSSMAANYGSFLNRLGEETEDNADLLVEETEINEALGTMANIKKASKEAAARSADPRTKPGDAPAWLKQAIRDKAAKKVQKEEVELEEAKQNVFKTAHTWGSTTKVYHNDDHSSHYYILHPEHVAAVKKLNDGEHTKFTDETGNHVTAHRKGDTIHFTGSKLRTGSSVTTADRKHFMEEVEQVDEKSLAALAPPRDKVTKKDILVGRGILKKHPADPNKHVLAKEDVELDEAKRGRPRKDGSKPAGDDDHQEADKNIHTQLHKVISANKPVTFNNGKTHTITSAHAHKALSMLQNAKASDRLAIQHSLSHSHDRFHETLKSGKAIVDAPRPKVSLAKSVKEDVQVDEARGAVTVSDRRERIAVQATNPTTGRPTVRWSALPKRTVKVSEALSKENMAQDSVDKIKKDPLASKEKIDLPATTGNKPIGGEGQAYSGKSTMAEEVSLNNLYNTLSEQNKVKFKEKMQTVEGKEELLKFAQEQGL